MSLSQADNGGMGGAPASKTCTGTDADANAFLSSLIKATKDLLLYPASNPVVSESIETALRHLKADFSADHMVELLVEKDQLLANGAQLGAKDSRIREFCLSLYKRGIQKIVIDSGVPFEEMRELITILTMKPEEIAEAGGVERLAKNKGLIRAAVEGTAELTIVDGEDLAVSNDLIPELEGLEDIERIAEQTDSPEGFARTFVRMEGEDGKSLNRLRALLSNPAILSRLLEKLAFRVETMEEELDASGRVERMLKVLETIGTAIVSLQSTDERAQLFKELAVSVLGLSVNLREELISQGLVPNLALKSVEAAILGRFPISKLADALLKDFEFNGATAPLMQGYFDNLDLSRGEQSALAETLRNGLSETEMLTPEVDAVLTVEEAEPDTMISGDENSPASEIPIPQIEEYPPEKILFQGDERSRLITEVSEELGASAADIMAPALLELIRHEETPVNHAALVKRATSFLEHFLAERNYESAAILVEGLQAEDQEKTRIFSSVQLKPLRDAIAEYLGEHSIRRLIDTMQQTKRESADFEKLVRYFDALGSPAIKTLVHALEDEESRHVRLLICQALVRIGDKSIPAVAKKIDHSNWYVVRNMVSILGQIGKPGTIPYLRKALAHEEIRVRKEALKALASIRTDAAIELVCGCVEDDEPTMCKAAIEWAAAMEAEQAVPALERILNSRNLWRKDEEIVRLAIEALGSIGSQPAAELLEKMSRVRNLFRHKRAALIRTTATVALRSIGGD
jgi:hypothetical protein